MWVPKVFWGVFPWNFGCVRGFFFLDASKICHDWLLSFLEVQGGANQCKIVFDILHDSPKAQTCTFECPGASNTTKITPREREKERKWGWCPEGPRRLVSRRVDRPKFRAFFSSHVNFHSFFLFWESFRGILVVFEPEMCTFGLKAAGVSRAALLGRRRKQERNVGRSRAREVTNCWSTMSTSCRCSPTSMWPTAHGFLWSFSFDVFVFRGLSLNRVFSGRGCFS